MSVNIPFRITNGESETVHDSTVVHCVWVSGNTPQDKFEVTVTDGDSVKTVTVAPGSPKLVCGKKIVIKATGAGINGANNGNLTPPS